MRRVIYALRDPGRPDVVKIGKDEQWPKRLRQAHSHSPRPFEIVGLWPIPQDETEQLSTIERKVHRLFPNVKDCDGSEWFRANPQSILEQVSLCIKRASVTDSQAIKLKPFDDWRDWPNPSNSSRQRRLWVARERQTERLKIIHSWNIKPFFKLCPTYNCFGLRWIEVWIVRDQEWIASAVAVNEPDRRLVGAWTELVNQYGGGANDLHVGWLEDGVSSVTLSMELGRRGLKRIRPLSLTDGIVLGAFVEIDRI